MNGHGFMVNKKSVFLLYLILFVGDTFAFDINAPTLMTIRPEMCFSKPNYRVMMMGLPVPELPLSCETYGLSFAYIHDKTDFYLSWNFFTGLLAGAVIVGGGPKWLLYVFEAPQFLGNFQFRQQIISEHVNVYFGEATDYFLKYASTNTRAGFLFKINRFGVQGGVVKAWSGPFRDEKLMYEAALAYTIPRKK